MRLLVIVLCVLAASALSTKHLSMAARHVPFSLRRLYQDKQDDMPMECLQAMSAACPNMPNTESNELPTKSQLDSVCSTCIPKIKSALQSSACSGVPTATLALLPEALNIVCMKRDGQYCVLSGFTDKAVSASDDRDFDFRTASATDLKFVCDPCFLDMFAAVEKMTAQAIGTGFGTGMDVDVSEMTSEMANLRNSLGAMCLKDNSGNFCAPKLQTGFATVFDDDTATVKPSVNDKVAAVTQMCAADTCLPRMINALIRAQASQISTSKMQMALDFCAHKSPEANSPLCGELMIKGVDRSAIGCGQLSPDDAARTHNTSCVSFYQNAFTQLGCCASAYKAAVDSAYHESYPQLSVKCSAQANRTHTVSFPNLKYAYFASHQAEVEALLKRDVAVAAGVSASDITIAVHKKGDGVTVDAMISFASEATANSDNARVSSELKSASTFAGLASLPAAASVDGSSSVVADANSAAPVRSVAMIAVLTVLSAVFLL